MSPEGASEGSKKARMDAVSLELVSGGQASSAPPAAAEPTAPSAVFLGILFAI